MHFSPPQIWEENGGASYSPNVAYLAHGGQGVAVEQGFFPYFPPLKPRCVLWSGASYSPKNMVPCSGNFLKNLFQYIKITLLNICCKHT